MNKTRLFFALVLASGVAVAQPAQAYLDPGTGSIILQVLLGGVAGILVVVKLYWRRAKEFVGGGKEKPDDDTGQSGE